MINALLVFAVLCACAGAWKGNRAAMALLASTALTSALIWAEVPFNPWLWLAIDAAVILVMASHQWTVAKVLILALFVPAWVFYAVPRPEGPGVTGITVSLQLLLTFPVASVWRRIKRDRERHPDNWNEFDLRVVHEPGG